MLAPTRKDVLVRMPGELKRLLAGEVRRTGQSLNDVAVGILASRFAVQFEPSGRPGKEPGKSGSVLLRMPAELKETLAARAAQRKRKLNDLIIETLSERLGKEPMAATNGKVRRSDDKVRVAIIGVGNCASSLVQGVEYYKDAEPGTFVPGLMHVDLGGYHISDIEFTAAFDVTIDKVGKDLADAIWAHPNNTIKFADVIAAEVHVHEAGDELVVRRVVVILDSLEERVRAVADADDRDADLVLLAPATRVFSGIAVRFTH